MVITRKIIKRSTFAATLLLLALAGYWCFRPESPERQVRKVLTLLCENASKGGGEKTTAGLLKNRALGLLFGPKVPMDFRAETFCGSFTPAEITANAARLRMLFAHVRFQMDDLVVTIESPERARAEFAGRLTGMTRTGAKLDEVRELVCRLEKLEEKWKITGITVREVLER